MSRLWRSAVVSVVAVVLACAPAGDPNDPGEPHDTPDASVETPDASSDAPDASSDAPDASRDAPDASVPTCGPGTCNGCCLPDGTCASGLENTACGQRGGACTACGTALRCVAGACGSTGPLDGETCARARPLSFTSGANGARSATVREDIARFVKDDPLDCDNGWNIDHDVSFAFTLTEPTNVRAEAQWAGSPVGKILYLRLVKATCRREDSIACEGEFLDRINPIVAGALPAGDYRLVVSAFLDGPGAAAFDLKVDLTPPPPGEACASPIPLGLSPTAGGQTSVQGDSATYLADIAFACGGGSSTATRGRDVVYAFSNSVPMNLEALATTTDQQFRLALLLRRADACTGTESVLCAVDGGSWSANMRVSLAQTALPPGDWVLVVDGNARPGYSSDRDGGPYALSVKLTPTLAGETCGNPLPLVFSNGLAGGSASAAFSTAGMLNDYGWCGGSGPDAAYAFSIDRELDFSATVDNVGVLALLRGGDCGSGNFLGCNQTDLQRSTNTALRVGSLPPGDYRLLVDSPFYASVTRTFSVSASLTPHQQGETCSNPLPLAFSNGAAGGTATVSGDLSGFFHQKAPCDTSSSPDVVYSFTTDRTLNFDATATAAGGGAFQGKVILTKSCEGTSCLEPRNSYSQVSHIAHGSLPAGTYLLIVDGTGPFTLSARLTTPPLGDSCANAEPLFPSGQASGTVTKQVTLGDKFDDLSPSCISYETNGADVFYRFTTSAPMNVRARAVRSGTSYMVPPDLYVVPAGCGAGAVACARSYSDTNVLEKGGLPAGDWLLVVDASGTGASYYDGPYDLTVTVTPPLAGETCSNALPLPLSGGTTGSAKVSGDTTTFFGDVDSVCEARGQKTPGHDVVYAFDTSATTNLRVSLKATSSGFKPSVFHAQSSGGSCAYDSRLCAYVPSYTTSEHADYPQMPAGRHYLVVDSASGEGGYELEAKVLPIVQGESCANPIPLTLSNGAARVTSDASSWFPDHKGSCASDGEDAVYSFTTTTSRYVKATVTTSAPEAQHVPSVYLRTGNCSTGAEKGCTRGSGGSAVLAAMVPAGTHYLFVDGALNQLNSGAWTLDLFVGDPPQGETCANPIPLTLSNGAAGGTATVSGDTTTFLADTTPSCGGFSGTAPSAEGRDVVYSFTTNRTLNLSAKLEMQSNGGFDGVLTLRSNCGSGSDTACVGGVGAYSPQTITKSALPAGTYFLTVDNGFNANGRSYTLSVTLTP